MTPQYPKQWRRKRAGLDGNRFLVRSSPGHDIVPEIVVADTDVIVDKTACGAFTYTDLEHVLQGPRGILAPDPHGMHDRCLRALMTLREANDRNFQCCLMVRGRLARAETPTPHAAAVHMVTVEDGIFGVVAKTDDVVSALDGLRATAAPAVR